MMTSASPPPASTSSEAKVAGDAAVRLVGARDPVLGARSVRIETRRSRTPPAPGSRSRRPRPTRVMVTASTSAAAAYRHLGRAGVAAGLTGDTTITNVAPRLIGMGEEEGRGGGGGEVGGGGGRRREGGRGRRGGGEGGGGEEGGRKGAGIGVRTRWGSHAAAGGASGRSANDARRAWAAAREGWEVRGGGGVEWGVWGVSGGGPGFGCWGGGGGGEESSSDARAAAVGEARPPAPPLAAARGQTGLSHAAVWQRSIGGRTLDDVAPGEGVVVISYVTAAGSPSSGRPRMCMSAPRGKARRRSEGRSRCLTGSDFFRAGQWTTDHPRRRRAAPCRRATALDTARAESSRGSRPGRPGGARWQRARASGRSSPTDLLRGAQGLGRPRRPAALERLSPAVLAKLARVICAARGVAVSRRRAA